jgi:hypothetical protein
MEEAAMSSYMSQYSTGLKGLDFIIKELIPGDNVVWHINSIEDYRLFVDPFCETALQRGQSLTYFHFAKHPPLVKEQPGVRICILNPDEGFEAFILGMHSVIREQGRGGCYVFDCLSDLAVDWFSDQMLANFFMLTCPFLLDIEAIAYFAIEKFKHSSYATSPIVDTTQIFIDIYHHKDKIYIHPIKVQQRYSMTMHMLHLWQDGQFIPVTNSAQNAEILAPTPLVGSESASRQYDIWNRTFREGQIVMDNIEQGVRSLEREAAVFGRIIRMAVTRDEKLLELIKHYMTLEDVVALGKRIIGTGLIGGKSIGMLLARAILKKKSSKWKDVLEIHDSFYIGSDIFYTFLVQNGCWWAREQQKDLDHFLQHAEHARRLIHRGKFPDYIIRMLSDMLDYFGQSPIIVRSSSLLEDNFGNAFSGKYESVFLPNRGPREKCLEDLMTAIKNIFASTMSEQALLYRSKFGLLEKDEQMSLLVQRVSGDMHTNIFYPFVSGVAYSFNPFVWNNTIDPNSGVLRLVFGMGTRAVERSDDDYTRIVALNAPDRRPESGLEEVRKYSQKKVDVLDLESNRLASMDFREVVRKSPELPIHTIASRDHELERQAEYNGKQDAFSWIITFDELLQKTNFTSDMREMLRIIQSAYNYPVDVEFTANVSEENVMKINIVQCRPFQGKDGGTVKEISFNIHPKNIILKTGGPVIGQSRNESIDRIIYVVPSKYSELSISDKYTLAHTIGKIANLKESAESKKKVMLIGPGRWGTTTPALGVPVVFSEISSIEFLVEIVEMNENLIPDISLGTHFFNDLVDYNILYMGAYPHKEDTILNKEVLEGTPSKLKTLLPEAAHFDDVIRVIDSNDIPGIKDIMLYANTQKQQVICYTQNRNI